uniref:Uncharacterized protein n=1 Tax=Solanum lycopersicum TaxID=4081 RepID=A0A3Q7JJ16_SOLLC
MILQRRPNNFNFLFTGQNLGLQKKENKNCKKGRLMILFVIGVKVAGAEGKTNSSVSVFCLLFRTVSVITMVERALVGKMAERALVGKMAE